MIVRIANLAKGSAYESRKVYRHGRWRYPVCGLGVCVGDHFLLYTDGVIEPQNASGDSVGDCKLEEVVHNHQARPPSEFADQLLSEIRHWQPATLAQQDDITVIVIAVA